MRYEPNEIETIQINSQMSVLQ